MNMMIKGGLALLWLVFVPMAAGLGFTGKDKKITPGDSLLTGYLLMLACMEAMALPLIFMRVSLMTLCMGYGALMGALVIFGLIRLFLRRKELTAALFPPRWDGYLAAALLIIAFQVYVCVTRAHFDADDSFFVALATTDVQDNTLFGTNVYLGTPTMNLPKRYVLSPFPVFLAVISKLSGGLHPAIMAHMIFPLVFLPAAYLVQYRISRKLFPKDRSARSIYLLLSACICGFSAYSVCSAETFKMIRLWQGKAFLAGILLPLAFCLCLEYFMAEKPKCSWWMLLAVNISSCLVSSMGIILEPLMLGCFALVCLIWHRDLKRVTAGVMSCLVSYILAAVYLFVL